MLGSVSHFKQVHNIQARALLSHNARQIRVGRRQLQCRSQIFLGGKKFEKEMISKDESNRKIGVGIVISKFNDLITEKLATGAKEGLEDNGVIEENIDVVYVPGSFEIPLMAKYMARSTRYDVVIAVGAVIRGDTTHYDAVCSAVTSGVLDASSSTGTPVIFCVLTCDTLEQALNRAGGKSGNKGYEAAVTAIRMHRTLQELQNQELIGDKWGKEDSL